jgi:hypothetical protein
MPTDRRKVMVAGWYVRDATGENYFCAGADQEGVELYCQRLRSSRSWFSRDEFARAFSVAVTASVSDAERTWADGLVDGWCSADDTHGGTT